MKTLFSTLYKQPTKYVWRLSLLVVLILCFFSAIFSKIIFLELFYVFPITLAAWYGSKKSGLILALLASLLVFLVKGFQYEFSISNALGYSLPCIISFSVLALLITNFRSVHREECSAADTDYLTSILNARGFYIELANELLRSSRYKHIFSLAYIDIDNFKFINDSQGHAEGDSLLIEVARCLKEALRTTDIIGRLGGDEFACLLPETKQEEAKAAFLKASKLLQSQMEINDWSVTFSVGLVTFETIPADIREAMKIADDLMYSVKKLKKDNISYTVWCEKALPYSKVSDIQADGAL